MSSFSRPSMKPLAAALACAAAVFSSAEQAHAQEPPPPMYYHVPPSAGPRVISDWQEGEPIPAGYFPTKRMRTPLVIAGAVTFGTTYLCTALGGAIAADAGADHAASLLVPVAGPFIMLGSIRSATGGFALVLDGLAQTAGVAMLVAGIAMPKAVLVRKDIGKIEISPTPMQFGTHGGGFGFVGRF
ncbi:Hypothetical protein A7982_02013 [Minicystis rosea]|nr:Hypothetical protein A7982_02013 [Minicystis rosea]